MSETQLILRKWEDFLKAGKFEGLAQEIKETDIKPSTKLDTSWTRLLVFICHYVTSDEKVSSSTASEIKKIISAIHLKLFSIPDPVKYFSSLYHVVRIFLSSKHHQEALEVTNYFLPGTVWSSAVEDPSYISKLTTLWASSLVSYLKSNKTRFEKATELIKYQLKLRLLCDPDEHRVFINDLDSYFMIIKSYEDEKYKEGFQSFIMKIETLTDTKISLGTKDKYRTYESFLRLITDILSDKINIKGIKKISGEKIKQLFDPFREAVKADYEINKCFAMYELMCSIFTRPVSAFDKVTVCEIDTYIQTLDKIIQKHGVQNAVTKNSNHVLLLLQFVLFYWETYAKTKEKFDIPVELIPKLLSLIIHQADLFSKIEISSCKKCSSDKCTVKKDIQNSIGVKIRILLILSRIAATSEDLRRIGFSVFEDCVKIVSELKENNCESWLKNWTLCCSRIYNIILQYDENHYQDYILFSELLCTKIKSFGVEKLLEPEENFLAICLHRLGSTHYHNKNYKAAMEVASLSAYVGLTTGEGSSFRTWANCKYRYPSAKSMTMVECLESNKTAARFGITVLLDDSQKRQICLQEIKGLENCPMNMVSSILVVVELLQTLDPSPIEYAEAIHLLGYHQLDFQNSESLEKFLTTAKMELKKSPKTPSRQLLYGNLQFYSFVQKLADIRSTIEAEMLTSTMRLSVKIRGDLASSVVPAYSLINITTSSNLEASLERVLEFWTKYCEQEGLIESFGKFLTPSMMIRLVIIAGEYAKFYHFRGAEISAWKLAMSLASKFKDERSIMYICSRSIMSRYLNIQWIALAQETADKLKASSVEEITESIAMFKFSLSSYYFYLGRIDEAKKIFDEALESPMMKFTKNYPTYLYAMDILISERLNYDECFNKHKYMQAIIEGLYTVILIEDNFLSSHNLPREDLLYRLDIAMEFTSHMTLRMNSLLSYREISAHLMRRLKVVQKLGSTLHVAEYLKNLCFLDLSRNQLEDCEVKLQGLEHILKLDSFDFGKATKSKKGVNIFYDNSPIKLVELVRDIPHNDASPVLMTKIFSSPDFMEHDKDCKCFKCTNFAYKYMVFSCTHIRAQLYAAQNNVAQAVEHFYGALQIIKKLIDVQVENFEIVSQRYVEFVLFLLDFAKFIKYSVPNGDADALSMLVYALNICETHKIKNHPVYFCVKEVIFEARFQETFLADLYAKFVVPDARSEVQGDEMITKGDICTTPVRGDARTIVKVKRRNTPPIITFGGANIDRIEEDNDCLTPVVACDNQVKVVKKPSRVMKVKPIRRKISDSEYLTPNGKKNNDLNSGICQVSGDSKEISESKEQKGLNLNPPKIKIKSVEKANLDLNLLRKTREKSEVTGGDDVNSNACKSRTKIENSTGRTGSNSKGTKEQKIRSEREENVSDLDLNNSDNSKVRKTRSGLTARAKTNLKAEAKNELDTIVEDLQNVHISQSTTVGKSRCKSKDLNAEEETKSTQDKTSRNTEAKNVIDLENQDEENSNTEEPRRSRRIAAKKSEPDINKFKILKLRN
ncbi:uncharacterized protein LOC123269029 [Cotesia glomerata]|uniref:Separase n=1 Tax=Cotesia glomerata TaxID=32391 RepID=A0AAV7HPX1_COTGL|nr:uncharacterized protein LOC123269029 [Cotesia glomerata]XP_044590457.1 uncharacterized protein LOC123269029 [Cotesia glomerata]KAH0546192.1 hypothetical protein KQX54_007067 [Cotesia glomerata]